MKGIKNKRRRREDKYKIIKNKKKKERRISQPFIQILKWLSKTLLTLPPGNPNKNNYLLSCIYITLLVRLLTQQTLGQGSFHRFQKVPLLIHLQIRWSSQIQDYPFWKEYEKQQAQNRIVQEIVSCDGIFDIEWENIYCWNGKNLQIMAGFD